MKYDITIIRISYDGTAAAEKIALVGASEAVALKVLDIYGLPGYDIKICGYTDPESRKKGRMNYGRNNRMCSRSCGWYSSSYTLL